MNKKSSQTVGKYEILEKLGEGGFGIVYKANDTTLDRLVAIKQLKVELSSSPEYLERFKRESRLMGSLNHPNIVKMLEVLEDSGRYFIVMEYMPGGSLADRLVGGKSLSLEKTLEILQPIAKAIDYAHSKNLIHRDIKPSNILFMEGDEPVLTDFGLVKSLDTKGQTTTGVAFGTPQYMSPEQILCRELTPATDEYALAVVAYQMLSGIIPFDGDTPFEIQESQVHKDVPDILGVNRSLPEESTAIFMKALAKKPEERFGSARALINELDDIADKRKAAQSQEKFNTALEKMREKDYEGAASLLSELLAIRPDEKMENVLSECKRREMLLVDYKLAHTQMDQILEKLKNLEADEKWIIGNGDYGIVRSRGEKIVRESVDSQIISADEERQVNKWIIFTMIFISVSIICSIISSFVPQSSAVDVFVAGGIVILVALGIVILFWPK